MADAVQITISYGRMAQQCDDDQTFLGEDPGPIQRPLPHVWTPTGEISCRCLLQ